ncbi:hypothetical protein BYT27DRAFT_6375302 [Phlegmacium glaucopus]|nr:hypothetical protein BYT27DRAFT_6375302 [Phlegmacium glaucopus]
MMFSRQLEEIISFLFSLTDILEAESSLEYLQANKFSFTEHKDKNSEWRCIYNQAQGGTKIRKTTRGRFFSLRPPSPTHIGYVFIQIWYVFPTFLGSAPF